MMFSVFKCRPEANIPSYATRFSACFDLYACLPNDLEVKFYDSKNCASTKIVNDLTITLNPGDRVLIPTGLIFNISPCNSIRLHPRSGLSVKSGLILSNCEGVIDEDYCEEVFVSLLNISEMSVSIFHHDRICQGELIRDSRCDVIETFLAPLKKSTRNGGFGSTGK